MSVCVCVEVWVSVVCGGVCLCGYVCMRLCVCMCSMYILCVCTYMVITCL